MTGHLRLKEFTFLVVPVAKNYKELIIKRNPQFLGGFEEFSYETQRLIVKIFKQHIECENLFQYIKQRMGDRFISTVQMYNCIDKS